MKIGSVGSPGWHNEFGNEFGIACDFTKNWYLVLFGWYKTET